MKFPFSGISRQLHNEYDDLVSIFGDVIESGNLILGKSNLALEQELANLIGCHEVVTTGNGTDALEIVFRFLNLPSRSVVLTTGNSGGYATVAARLSGLDVHFIDVKLDSGLLDVEQLQEILKTHKISVVVYTHLYGNLGDIRLVAELCRVNNVVLIEDCAQAMGLFDIDRHVGTFGRFGILSFYPTKNLGALGDGGAIIVNSSEDNQIRFLRQYGWTEKYSVKVANGRNSRMDEIQASFLTYRLKMLKSSNQRRLSIARQIKASTHQCHGDYLLTETSTAHLLVLRCRDRFQTSSMLSESGIPWQIHYPTCDFEQIGWSEYGKIDKRRLKNSIELSRSVLSIPCYNELTDAEVRYICDVMSTELELENNK